MIEGMRATDGTDFEPIPRLKVPGERLVLGVLGASRIVPLALRAAWGDEFPVHVRALAARAASRAQAMARDLNIELSYGSYEALLADPTLDAVYVALPCSEHARYCLLALQAGKHVLCEKPFAMSSSQASEVLASARTHRRLVMEALHWKYHALLPEVARLIAQLGPLSMLDATFNAGLNRDGDIRKNPSLGAGVTMDFGCYALSWVSWAASCAQAASAASYPTVQVQKVQMVEETAGVDVALRAQLSVDGVSTVIACDMRDQTPFVAHLTVEGRYGRVHFDNPLVVHGSSVSFEPNRLGAQRGLHPEHVVPHSQLTTYAAQLLAFVQALRDGRPPVTAGDQILQNQRLLDEMYVVAGLESRLALQERQRSND